MRIDDGQDSQLVAEGQLVMNKIHGPDIIRADGFGAIVASLRFHASLWALIAKLKP
jgi:hypothetical protein